MTNLKKLPALSSLFAASIKAPAIIFVLLVALAVPSPVNGEPETVPKTAPTEEKTKEVSVSRAYILKKLALALLKCGRKSEALEKIDLAFSLDPYNSDLRQTRAYILKQCEKPNATPKETKRRETEIDSNNYKLAKEFYDKNAYKQAIEYCNKELETPKTSKNPKTFRRTRVALKLRGLCYLAIGEEEKAMTDFEHYVDLSALSRSTEATKASSAKQLIDDLPLKLQLSYKFKSVLQNQLRLEKLYSKMIELSNFHNEASFERAMLYLGKGDLNSAACDFESYFTYGDCYHRLDALSWSIFCNKALKREAKLKELLAHVDRQRDFATKPELLFLQDKNFTAEELVAVSTDKKDQIARGTIAGMVLAQKGNLEEAAKYLQKVIETAPDTSAEYFVAKKELERIKK
ncbi:MAG: hypothetical protein J0M35_16875 [Candidatus Obscuribacter phosphatis]|uniref:Tetratricopeptide repeat protein n=1 Tax=Candidatus Obscuribacter phosphatis TaxID=1906157 RepID=A0A8J7PKB8_9BACT|nr:hypothetical protein [Candidatus Obscuribacter phosphatis]